MKTAIVMVSSLSQTYETPKKIISTESNFGLDFLSRPSARIAI